MSAMTNEERFDHGVGPRDYRPQREATGPAVVLIAPALVICQVCGHLVTRGLEKHPDCKPRVVPTEREPE